MSEAEAAAEAAMEAAETEAAAEAAANAENAANEGFDQLTPEEQKARQAENDRVQATATSDIINSLKLPDGSELSSREDINKLQDTSRSLAESVETPGQILPKLKESAASIDEDVGNRLNSSFRPFLETMSSKIESLIKDNSGEAKLTEFKNLQNKVTEAVENKDPATYEEATVNLDSFIEESLGESKTALEEKTEGRGNLKNFSRISSFLKLVGIIGLLGLLTGIFMMDNGCWRWSGGAKTQKLNDFDFSKDDNKKFCACSNTSDFDTPIPLSSWCPNGISKGNPTYVTCPPYQYPKCTIKTDPSGIYYSYYITSPLGIFNTLVNQTTKIVKKTGTGVMTFIRWGILILGILMGLYLLFNGVIDGRVSYYIMAIIIAILSGLGFYFI